MALTTQNQRETVLDRRVARLAPPPLYQVVLLNDDYTPMEFVVHVLQQIFHKSEEDAARMRGAACAASIRAISRRRESRWFVSWRVRTSIPCNALWNRRPMFDSRYVLHD